LLTLAFEPLGQLADSDHNWDLGMLGLLFLTAALQRVAQIVLCGLMIGSRGGKDFGQNTGKFQTL
jgi:hypothetical protein